MSEFVLPLPQGCPSGGISRACQQAKSALSALAEPLSVAPAGCPAPCNEELQTASPNFAFLGHHDPRLVGLGTQAEQHFAGDPNVTLYKLRQFCEVLAKRAAAKVGLLLDPREDLRRVIDALAERGAIGATQRDLFHQARRAATSVLLRVAATESSATTAI